MSWTIERRGRVAVVTMTTNPVNAQNQVFLADLHDAFDQLERDHPESPVVLTGTGRRFSAGLDLDEHFRLFAGDPAAVGWWFAGYRDEHAPVHPPASHRRRHQRPRLRRRAYHRGGLQPPHCRRRRSVLRAQRGADRHPHLNQPVAPYTVDEQLRDGQILPLGAAEWETACWPAPRPPCDRGGHRPHEPRTPTPTRSRCAHAVPRRVGARHRRPPVRPAAAPMASCLTP
jgi:hypothetical protein